MDRMTVVLTGASGGMGNEIRRMLEQNGCTVWALDIHGTDNPHFIPTDITDPSSVKKAFSQVKASSGKIDAIVHAAGIYDMNSLVEIPEDDFLRIFNVNLFGMYRVNRTFLPILNPKSRIIMVSSELAPLDPLPFNGIYAITKSAVEKYAYSLRMELQLLGHSVTVIRPGAVRTPFLDSSKKRIEAFCDSTEYYRNTSRRFLSLVNRIETANVSPQRVAEAVQRALTARRPRYIYNINRSPLLRIFNALPWRLQNLIIREVLSN